MTKDDLINRTGQLISKIHAFETSLGGQGGDHEVTALQLDLLQILYFTGRKNLSSLSQCLNINLPNSSREVKKLTNTGFIEKKISLDDKRKTDLTLSEKGKSKVESSLDEMKNQFFDTSKNWSPERIESCINAIDVLENEIFK